MDASELRALIEQGEGQRLEFKTSLSEMREILEALAAFRNAQGGDVLVGVDPNGAPSGKVQIGANTLENLAGDIQKGIDPAPFPTLDSGELDGKTIIRVSVDGKREGVVFFVRPAARARVGRSNQAMTATHVKEIHRGRLELPDDWSGEVGAPVFDMRPASHNAMGKGPNKINVTFAIRGEDVRPRYHWIGEDISNEWLIPMEENPRGSRRYTTQPTAFSPTSESGVVSFEAVFAWRGATCHAQWDFPFSLVPKNSYINLVIEAERKHLIPRCWREPRD